RAMIHCRALKAEKLIVVTGLIPYWMFGKCKMRILEVPKMVFGDEVRVDTVANPQLKDRAADAAAILSKLSWSGEEVGSVMLAIREGAKPDEAAKDWIAKNPDRVAEWLK